VREASGHPCCCQCKQTAESDFSRCICSGAWQADPVTLKKRPLLRPCQPASLCSAALLSGPDRTLLSGPDRTLLCRPSALRVPSPAATYRRSSRNCALLAAHCVAAPSFLLTAIASAGALESLRGCCYFPVCGSVVRVFMFLLF
jgi:hypothetical protein